MSHVIICWIQILERINRVRINEGSVPVVSWGLFNQRPSLMLLSELVQEFREGHYGQEHVNVE